VAGALAGHRARIDELDTGIRHLVAERMAVSAEIQRLRLEGGGGRIDTGREDVVTGVYASEFGPAGARLAAALLELCRGDDR
jgi:chorismate mutase